MRAAAVAALRALVALVGLAAVLSAFAAPRASPSRALAGTDHCTCSGPCPDYGKWTCRYANDTIDEKYKYGDKADCKAACHSSGLSFASAEDRAESLRRTLQPILEEQAARWNLSISYAFYDGATTVELAAGIQDHARQVPAVRTTFQILLFFGNMLGLSLSVVSMPSKFSFCSSFKVL